MLALIETVSTLTLTLTLNFILILNQIFVGWKQWLFGPKKNQSFRNKSAKRSRSGPNSVYVVDMSRGDDVQVIFGAIGPFSAKWGLGRVPRSASFFVVNQTTFRELRNGRFTPNLVTKRISVSRRGIRKDIFENFHFIFTFPQNLK